jgi:hypothetical protein
MGLLKIGTWNPNETWSKDEMYSYYFQYIRVLETEILNLH